MKKKKESHQKYINSVWNTTDDKNQQTENTSNTKPTDNQTTKTCRSWSFTNYIINKKIQAK